MRKFARSPLYTWGVRSVLEHDTAAWAKTAKSDFNKIQCPKLRSANNNWTHKDTAHCRTRNILMSSLDASQERQQCSATSRHIQKTGR